MEYILYTAIGIIIIYALRARRKSVRSANLLYLAEFSPDSEYSSDQLYCIRAGKHSSIGYIKKPEPNNND